MKFLAIDTGGSRLVVAAENGGRTAVRAKQSAMSHSVYLMEEIDAALREVELSLSACEFIACVVGPGSFTGIRIGISTVKGLCMAQNLPALAVTSFDCLAYADKREKLLALVDAGHGAFYACPYENMAPLSAAYRSREETEALIGEGYAPVSEGGERGLIEAVHALAGRTLPADRLTALYLRKSAAEEGR